VSAVEAYFAEIFGGARPSPSGVLSVLFFCALFYPSWLASLGRARWMALGLGHCSGMNCFQSRLFLGLAFVFFAVAKSAMPRELVWLENHFFAAWGCRACGWIVHGRTRAVGDKPPADVVEAFNQHECSKYPRRSPA
jgi:hypothetical protein